MADGAEVLAAGDLSQLVRFAVGRCGEHEQAADAVAEVVARCLPRLQQGELDAPVAYLTTAVANQLRSQWRRTATFRRLVPHLEVDVETAAPDHALTVAHRDLLRRALAELPERQRLCVGLRHYEGRSVRETAEAVGISEGGVKSATSRGLRSMRAYVLAATG